MNIIELMTTPIEELYECGILREPEPEQNEKKNRHTFQCLMCGDTYTETWGRNNPDAVALRIYCIVCNKKTMALSRATPYTTHYKSRAMERSSFCDDVSEECWQCGSKEELITTAFSNSQPVKLCKKEHFRPFIKDIIRASERKRKLQEEMQREYDIADI